MTVPLIHGCPRTCSAHAQRDEHTHTRAHPRMPAHTRACPRTTPRTPTPAQTHSRTRTSTHSPARPHARTRTRTGTRSHARARAHTHTHKHTHPHARTRWCTVSVREGGRAWISAAESGLSSLSETRTGVSVPCQRRVGGHAEERPPRRAAEAPHHSQAEEAASEMTSRRSGSPHATTPRPRTAPGRSDAATTARRSTCVRGIPRGTVDAPAVRRTPSNSPARAAASRSAAHRAPGVSTTQYHRAHVPPLVRPVG